MTMSRNVHLHIEGSLLERLVNRALQAGASFHQIRRTTKRSMLVCADEHSAAILVSLCKKYFLDCRILEHSNISILRAMIRARATLFGALALCAVLCTLFLGRIWMVDIDFIGPRPELGNRIAILSCLQENGVKAGLRAGQIDAEFLQKQLLSRAGNYSFIGVRRQGIRLLVEAAPEIPFPETYQISSARDLVAARDGVVESITVLAGSACVKPGDTVRAGQTLIRGEETIGKDSETQQEITSPVSALGKVIARCWYEGTAEGYIEMEEHIRTGNTRTSCLLKLLDFSLPIIQAESYHSQETEIQHLPIVGMFLPLEMEKSIHHETRVSTHTTEPETLRLRLEKLATAEVFKQLCTDGIQYQIASHWTDAKQNDNILRLRAVYEIYTDIATTRDAFLRRFTELGKLRT